MCRPMTRGQWVSTRVATFSPAIHGLAQSAFAGEDKGTCIQVLHDALLDTGHAHFAEHFAGPEQSHSGKYAGEKACWGLLLLLGRLPRRRELLGTPTASEWVGLKPDQFRRLAARLPLHPEGSYDNPHHSFWRCSLWAPETVNSLVGSPEVAAVHEASRKRQEAKARIVAERAAAFGRRYRDWRTALPEAAEAMYGLDVYAKRRQCRPTHQDEVVDLKLRFLELLYRNGHAKGVTLHRAKGRRLPCHPCCGDDCVLCGGTGWYKQPDCRLYVAFRFEVGGRRYSWYEPLDLVMWPFVVTAEEGALAPGEHEKPVHLAPRDLPKAKALVQYVLAGSLTEIAA